jgi:hypothetical protein
LEGLWMTRQLRIYDILTSLKTSLMAVKMADALFIFKNRLVLGNKHNEIHS